MFDELLLGDILGIQPEYHKVKKNQSKKWKEDVAMCLWLDDLGREQGEQEKRAYEAWMKKLTGGEVRRRNTFSDMSENLFFDDTTLTKKRKK